MELEEVIEKITDILTSVYNKGFSDGETKQAILECRGPDKFIENLKHETEQANKPDHSNRCECEGKDFP